MNLASQSVAVRTAKRIFSESVSANESASAANVALELPAAGSSTSAKLTAMSTVDEMSCRRCSSHWSSASFIHAMRVDASICSRKSRHTSSEQPNARIVVSPASVFSARRRAAARTAAAAAPRATSGGSAR